MTINFNVTGAERKELVNLIANFTGCKSKYKGAPTFAYEVDYFTIDKNGALSFDDRADSEEIENLIEMLYNKGFYTEEDAGVIERTCELLCDSDFDESGVIEQSLERLSNNDCLAELLEPETGEMETPIAENSGARLIIEMPRDTFSDAAAQNLTALVESKAQLIKKALAADSLPIVITDERVAFDWFGEVEDGETVKAYTQFISAFCDMARNQKRVTAKEKPVDNEKYAFRCFLLRLGFIGKEFKTTRKILLRNLEGSSAYKSGQKSEVIANAG